MSPATDAAARPVLQVQGLTVQAGARQVVSGVDFEVNAGETVCLVGESGSGKSVSSFSVMGLLPPALKPTAGRVLVEGEDVLQATPQRLRELRATRMAMVFQEPMTALNPVMRVGAQIDEVLRLHARLAPAERRARVIEMLRSVQLPEPERLVDAFPHQLSGGQRQRIVIAMALILKPRLLIADEPTTALDVTTQKQILLLMRELQREQGTALLLVTHDFGVVADIADRIVVMNGGAVVESGSREEILARPRAPYTRMLVSSVPSLIPRQAGSAPTGEVVLDVAGLNKSYGERSLFRRPRLVHAACDVDLTLRRGEILGVVGESGSGKSTVARCIVRLLDPSSGSIRMGGADIAPLSGAALGPVRRRIQIVFQDPFRSLNPRRRVGESVIEGLLNAGTARAPALARAAELFRLVGLPEGALERYPHQFSGGQRQRICIARALALEPDILVADEAVSALDVSVQAQVLELLEDVRRKTGVAVLFITHDLRVAAQVCDTIVVMRQGRIVERGPAARVLADPSEAYTRSLIEAAPGRHWDFQNFRPAA